MEDIHIRILRCVHNHPNGITIPEIEKKLEVDIGSLKWINDECNTGSHNFLRQKQDANGNWIIILSLNGRAILLEYDELKEARKSSKQAKWYATCALLVTIFVGIADIRSPVELKQFQMEQLETLKPDLSSIQRSLSFIENDTTQSIVYFQQEMVQSLRSLEREIFQLRERQQKWAKEFGLE